MVWISLLAQVATVATVWYQLAIFPPDTTDPNVTVPLATLGVWSNEDLMCDLPPGTPIADPVVVTPTTTLRIEWTDLEHAGRVCRLPGPLIPIPPTALPRCLAAPCPLYPVMMGAWSKPAHPTLTVAPTDLTTACRPTVGAEAVSVFVTGVETGRPGGRALVRYQLASRSPVTRIRVRIDGVVQPNPVIATDATQTGSVWFRVPPPGTHRLTVEATNAFGCVQERAALPLVVR